MIWILAIKREGNLVEVRAEARSGMSIEKNMTGVEVSAFAIMTPCLGSSDTST